MEEKTDKPPLYPGGESLKQPKGCKRVGITSNPSLAYTDRGRNSEYPHMLREYPGDQYIDDIMASGIDPIDIMGINPIPIIGKDGDKLLDLETGPCFLQLKRRDGGMDIGVRTEPITLEIDLETSEKKVIAIIGGRGPSTLALIKRISQCLGHDKVRIINGGNTEDINLSLRCEEATQQMKRFGLSAYHSAENLREAAISLARASQLTLSQAADQIIEARKNQHILRGRRLGMTEMNAQLVMNDLRRDIEPEPYYNRDKDIMHKLPPMNKLNSSKAGYNAKAIAKRRAKKKRAKKAR